MRARVRFTRSPRRRRAVIFRALVQAAARSAKTLSAVTPPRRGRPLMRRSIAPSAFCIALTIAVSCSDQVQAPEKAIDVPETALNNFTNTRIDPDPLSGGATTVFDTTADAFGHAAPNLDAEGAERHEA